MELSSHLQWYIYIDNFFLFIHFNLTIHSDYYYFNAFERLILFFTIVLSYHRDGSRDWVSRFHGDAVAVTAAYKQCRSIHANKARGSSSSNLTIAVSCKPCLIINDSFILIIFFKEHFLRPECQQNVHSLSNSCIYKEVCTKNQKGGLLLIQSRCTTAQTVTKGWFLFVRNLLPNNRFKWKGVYKKRFMFFKQWIQ